MFSKSIDKDIEISPLLPKIVSRFHLDQNGLDEGMKISVICHHIKDYEYEMFSIDIG